jgi:hypothetical protein
MIHRSDVHREGVLEKLYVQYINNDAGGEYTWKDNVDIIHVET